MNGCVDLHYDSLPVPNYIRRLLEYEMLADAMYQEWMDYTEINE